MNTILFNYLMIDNNMLSYIQYLKHHSYVVDTLRLSNAMIKWDTTSLHHICIESLIIEIKDTVAPKCLDLSTQLRSCCYSVVN